MEQNNNLLIVEDYYKKTINTKKTLYIYMCHSSILNSMVNGLLHVKDQYLKLNEGSFNLLQINENEVNIVHRNI
jgi:hypothetical protein